MRCRYDSVTNANVDLNPDPGFPKPRYQPDSLSTVGVLDTDGINAQRGRVEFEAVWPDVIVTDAALTQCIAELRKAFGDSATESRIIKTIPKAGFCLVPPVETLASQENIRARHSRTQFIVVSAIIVLFAVIASWRLIGVNQP